MWQKSVGVALALAALSSPAAWADEKAKAEEHEANRNEQREEVREQVYGYQLMTTAERDAYRERMRAARTVEEREQIRLDHHAQMQARAIEQGVSLPDMPMMRGQGMGGGGGMGPGGGMGGGGGMGSGGGMGRGRQ